FLLALNGPFNNFLMGDPIGKTPRGPASGTPLVNGGGQTGSTLVTDGWAPSITGILKAGDYIQIVQRLHKVLTDTNSDGSGNATLDIWPSLRDAGPADNTTIITTNTVGLFRLADNNYTVWSSDADKILEMGFSAVEDI